MAIKLFTTLKLPIIGNNILLPNAPVSDIVGSEGLVYKADGAVDNYSSVSVIFLNGNYYAQFEDDVEGFAVVSYLTDIR